MSTIKNGDRVVTPEGNLGAMLTNHHCDYITPDYKKVRFCIIYLDNGKEELWNLSVIKPHKEKRPFKKGDEIWVRCLIYDAEPDSDGDISVSCSNSGYSAQDLLEEDDLLYVDGSDVFHKEGIPND